MLVTRHADGDGCDNRPCKDKPQGFPRQHHYYLGYRSSRYFAYSDLLGTFGGPGYGHIYVIDACRQYEDCNCGKPKNMISVSGGKIGFRIDGDFDSLPIF